MPPTPPNTTSRLKLHYQSPTAAHVMLFHGLLGVVQADLKAAASAVASAMAHQLYTGSSFDSAEYAAAGSPIFNPISWTPVNSTSGVVYTPTANPASNFLQWGGRAVTSGKRVKLYLLQCLPHTNDKMRVAHGTDVDLDNVVDALQSNDEFIGNIAGEAVVWKLYVNVGQNDYLTHKARS